MSITPAAIYGKKKKVIFLQKKKLNFQIKMGILFQKPRKFPNNNVDLGFKKMTKPWKNDLNDCEEKSTVCKLLFDNSDWKILKR